MKEFQKLIQIIDFPDIENNEQSEDEQTSLQVQCWIRIWIALSRTLFQQSFQGRKLLKYIERSQYLPAF